MRADLTATDPGNKSDAFAGVPERDRATLLAIGPVWNDAMERHRDMVLDIYSPLVRGNKAGIAATLDVSYGRHERHILDIFRPAAREPRPVVLFVHGGAFTRGRKSLNGEIYDNVLYWFARQGFVGVNMEYRLAPEITFPGGAEDVAAAVAWVERNIQAYGGDPERIVLIGHSAGGTHVATYLLDPNVGLPFSPAVRGVVLISARLRADVRPENPNAKPVAAYLGDDPRHFEARSPVSYAARCAWPVFIAVAEYENRFLDVYGAEFFFRLAQARGRAPRFLRMLRHNHTSMVAHFNSGEERLGREILAFMAEECGVAP